MIAISVAVLASFRMTSRPCRDQRDLLWRGFESVGCSDFSAAMTGQEAARNDYGFCSFSLACRRNAPASRPAKTPLCDSDPFLSTSISASASVALSARSSEETNLRRREK